MYKIIGDCFTKGFVFGGVYVALGILGGVLYIDKLAKKHIQ